MQLSPVEFEQFCGMLLAGRGWSVEATRTTGDYGADIVAERDGVRLVVQC
ncbi:restriction endonuclease [Acidiphilium sp.]